VEILRATYYYSYVGTAVKLQRNFWSGTPSWLAGEWHKLAVLSSRKELQREWAQRKRRRHARRRGRGQGKLWPGTVLWCIGGAFRGCSPAHTAAEFRKSWQVHSRCPQLFNVLLAPCGCTPARRITIVGVYRYTACHDSASVMCSDPGDAHSYRRIARGSPHCHSAVTVDFIPV
jgi:hypothetical protein